MRVHDPAWCTASGLQASEYPRGVPGLALPDAVTLVAGLSLAGIPGTYACGIVGPRLLCQHGSHSRTVRASFPFTALFPEERTAPGMARGLLHRAQVTSTSTGEERPGPPVASQTLRLQVWPVAGSLVCGLVEPGKVPCWALLDFSTGQ